jgi:hypothetical protein
MGRTRLIDLLSHPEKLDEKTLDSLKEALDAYPFFSGWEDALDQKSA